jgi:hypothetical protein
LQTDLIEQSAHPFKELAICSARGSSGAIAAMCAGSRILPSGPHSGQLAAWMLAADYRF